jgi:hypothetical protein
MVPKTTLDIYNHGLLSVIHYNILSKRQSSTMIVGATITAITLSNITRNPTSIA